MPFESGYDTARMKVHLGTVGHFGLAVRDPMRSAKWWQESFDLETIFEGDDYIGLSNDDVTIVLSKGTPDPSTIDHMSFHLPDMTALRAALDSLKQHGVAIEDPGDEIGPEPRDRKTWACGFTTPTATGGSSRCRAVVNE
jgi:catechol 2,3-dioxygenase-like lactoylglutathione lyase family enzyme